MDLLACYGWGISILSIVGNSAADVPSNELVGLYLFVSIANTPWSEFAFFAVFILCSYENSTHITEKVSASQFHP